MAANISPHGLGLQQPAAEKTTELLRTHRLALKSGRNIVFVSGLRLHKVHQPQGDTGVTLCVMPPLIFRNTDVFQSFCDVPTCENLHPQFTLWQHLRLAAVGASLWLR